MFSFHCCYELGDWWTIDPEHWKQCADNPQSDADRGIVQGPSSIFITAGGTLTFTRCWTKHVLPRTECPLHLTPKFFIDPFGSTELVLFHALLAFQAQLTFQNNHSLVCFKCITTTVITYFCTTSLQEFKMKSELLDIKYVVLPLKWWNSNKTKWISFCPLCFFSVAWFHIIVLLLFSTLLLHIFFQACQLLSGIPAFDVLDKKLPGGIQRGGFPSPGKGQHGARHWQKLNPIP